MVYSLEEEIIALLQKLIRTPSFSKEEDRTAEVLLHFFDERGITRERIKNNVLVKNKFFTTSKPSLLLNSHHDTVKPNKSWTLDPFSAQQKDGKIYGLGSNDAGASLVSLLAVFLHFYERKDLPFNLLFLASAEEEISGRNGMEYMIGHLPEVTLAIVGEPTKMQMAISEKGLMVLDCTANGVAGHAARDEGENAIYKAVSDIQWIEKYHFPKSSEMLGPVKMTVAVISAGSQHNVVPDQCIFTIDVRSTDAYSNDEILEVLKQNLRSEVKARSLRLQPSKIEMNHPIVQAGLKIGLQTYGSPTLSDQALMPFKSIKIGPGDSARSHTADEFVYQKEIEEGIEIYIHLLEALIKHESK